jgi:hypothetical protein
LRPVVFLVFLVSGDWAPAFQRRRCQTDTGHCEFRQSFLNTVKFLSTDVSVAICRSERGTDYSSVHFQESPFQIVRTLFLYTA